MPDHRYMEPELYRFYKNVGELPQELTAGMWERLDKGPRTFAGFSETGEAAAESRKADRYLRAAEYLQNRGYHSAAQDVLEWAVAWCNCPDKF